MSLLQTTLSAIREPDAAAAAEAQRKLDAKTKPLGSLGRLEELARAVAGIRRSAVPEMPVKAMVVMAGDHGVAEEGVSAFPQEVTAQMVLNFAGGGAAINVISRQVGARLMVVDVGVKGDLPPLEGVRSGARGEWDAQPRDGARDDPRGGREGARGRHRRRGRAGARGGDAHRAGRDGDRQLHARRRADRRLDGPAAVRADRPRHRHRRQDPRPQGRR